MSPAAERPRLFVLLGAAGDLARRLVVPALFALHRSRMLPLGAQALAGRMHEGCIRFGRSAAPSDGAWDAFTHGLACQCLDLSDPDAYRSLPALLPIPPGAISDHASRGQYAAGWVQGERILGYRDEEGVALNSGTKTFAALKLFVDNWRWQGVPSYLRTGKRLAVTASEVSIRFRPVPHHAYPYTAAEDHQPVRLVLRLKRDEGLISRDGRSWLAPSLLESQP